MMENMLLGLHHVTATTSDAQQNITFYAHILGLRLVKQTINYDDPASYRLYYGDETGSPGSLLSFRVLPQAKDGAVGRGQFATVTLSISMDAIDFWVDRLTQYKVPFKDPQQRARDEVVIYLEDPDGLGIELIANERDVRKGFAHQEISSLMAIKGMYSVEIWLPTFFKTGAFLEMLGLDLIEEKSQTRRYAHRDVPGAYTDVTWGKDGAVGMPGTGTVEYMAWTVKEESDLHLLQRALRTKGLEMTAIRQWTYYKAFSVKNTEGLVFTFATEGPGFAVDEDQDALGQRLQLPIWEEFRRASLEAALPPIQLP
ncbi:MAG: VOC family protein [Bacteroidota bacterium]